MMMFTGKCIRRTLAAFGFFGLACASFNAAAAVITVGTGPSGFGGTLSASAGGNFVGSDINLGTLTSGYVPNNSGAYTLTNGILNFDTAANTLTVEGSIGALGITNQALMTGTFESWTYSNSGPTNMFSAQGFNDASDDLLNAFGVAPDTGFEFGVYTIEVDEFDEIVQSNMVTTSVVPLPAAAWLLGSALFGLMGIARRNRKLAAVTG